MTESQLDLARRLVAHPRFRWATGMAVPAGRDDGFGLPLRVHHITADGPLLAHSGGNRWPLGMHEEAIPDLTDYATAAILLRMAVEAGMTVNDGSKWGRWQNLPGTAEWFFVEGEAGTVAAQALLEAWGA